MSNEDFPDDIQTLLDEAALPERRAEEEARAIDEQVKQENEDAEKDLSNQLIAESTPGLEQIEREKRQEVSDYDQPRDPEPRRGNE